jgi:hypothetical protein
MRRESELQAETVATSSITLQLTSEEHQRKILGARAIFMFGHVCTVRPFTPLPITAVQCARCWRYGHHRTHCKNTPRCRLCGQDDHTEETHPQDIDVDTNVYEEHNLPNAKLKCANCEGTHAANARVCPQKIRARGEKKGVVGGGKTRDSTEKGDGGWRKVRRKQKGVSSDKKSPSNTSATGQPRGRANTYSVLRTEGEERDEQGGQPEDEDEQHTNETATYST